MVSNHEIIQEACNAIGNGHLTLAKKVIETNYPFSPMKNLGRKYSVYQKMNIFLRDGFIDRYSGELMIFPPVLRLLSNLMPDQFPFHKNWKTSECHFAYWQLLPTIDHIIPVSRGGADKESNCVCTSQLKNSAKSSWLLEELGWELHKPGDLNEWDGLVNWFMSYVEKNPGILKDGYMLSWHKAMRRTIET